MENGPFEDAFPIGNGDIPASYISLPKFNMLHLQKWWFEKPDSPGGTRRFSGECDVKLQGGSVDWVVDYRGLASPRDLFLKYVGRCGVAIVAWADRGSLSDWCCSVATGQDGWYQRHLQVWSSKKTPPGSLKAQLNPLDHLLVVNGVITAITPI